MNYMLKLFIAQCIFGLFAAFGEGTMTAEKIFAGKADHIGELCKREDVKSLTIELDAIYNQTENLKKDFCLEPFSHLLSGIYLSKIAANSELAPVLIKYALLASEISGDLNVAEYKSQFALMLEVSNKLDENLADIEKVRSRFGVLFLSKWEVVMHELRVLKSTPVHHRPFVPPASYDGIFISGMSPDDVANPEVRKLYQENLAQQAKSMKYVGRIHNLERLNKWVGKRAPAFLSKLFGKTPDSVKTIATLVSDNISDAKLVERINAAVTQRNN